MEPQMMSEVWYPVRAVEREEVPLPRQPPPIPVLHRPVQPISLSLKRGIRLARVRASLSVEELASAVDSTPDSIRAFERGDRIPDHKTTLALQKTLRSPLVS